MPLDPMQSLAVEKWFKAKCPNHACPACGGRTWTTLDVIGMDAVHSPGTAINVSATGKAYSSVVRMCDQCAHLAHFLLPSIVVAILNSAP